MTIRAVAIIAGTVATFAVSTLAAGTAPAEAAKAARQGPIIRDHRPSASQANNQRVPKHPCYYGCATVRDHRPTDWQPKNTDAAVRDHRDPWVPKPRLP